MGEVVVSSEDLEDVRLVDGDKRNEELVEKEAGNGVRNGLIKWENIFSRIVIRVLLVEADDSTRQIVAALLRKCSYRVAAVADGLKAWEVLKGRPRNIDLILTEVDLPSISGYALLTLIMEHDICKNIPVIMMSSQDSVSTVYKCMLRGAADYLVKPIRKNELRNLWQHVWRRQSSLLGGLVPPEESLKEDKVEGTSENNGASNYASGDAAAHQYKDCIEKGSDALSSCTKPEMEVESVPLDDAQDSTQPASMIPNDARMHDIHTSTSATACTVAFAIMENNNDPKLKVQRQTEIRGVHGSNGIQVGHGDIIDLISTSKNESFQFHPSSHLELSLRGCHGNVMDNQAIDERNLLRHSSASAFTRYTSKPMQPSLAAVVNHTEFRECSDAVHITSHNNDKSKEFEPFNCLQQRVVPIHVATEGMTFNKLCSNYGSILSSVHCKKSSASPTPSPSSASRGECAQLANGYHHSNHEANSHSLHRCLSCNTNDSLNQPLQKEQDHKVNGFEENGHVSPTTDQSANSSFCYALSHPNSIHHGNTPGGNSSHLAKNEENMFGRNNSHRSLQREAALMKFRMKRKDRCYEKKVRYESRKKLAEQRPRVKGQFVRQQEVDPPTNVTN